MAEEVIGGENLPEENRRTSGQDLSKFGDTAVAFDDMIVQVGRGIARAQELMDNSQVEFQKKAARAFSEGKIKRLDMNPSNAYTIPETSLDIKVGMSMSYPEGGGEPSLSATPLNASSTNENDINVEAATEIKLKFVSVPSSKEPPGPSPSALTRDEVVAMASEGQGIQEITEAGNYTLLTDYAEDARLWRIIWLKAKEPEISLFIDDRKGKVLDVIYRIYPPSLEEIAPVGAPLLKKVTPLEGKRGEYLVVSGDNFLTLSGQTVLTIDGQPIPLVRHTMKEITFKVPAWAVKGDVEIITPFGRTGESGKGLFNPLPSFTSFQPTRGYYDTGTLKGTRLTVRGDNLRPGCNIRFVTGALGRNVKVISPGLMEVEIPEDAGTGPLTLTLDEYSEVRSTPFIMLHSIEGFTPRQARIGEQVIITGARLEGVGEVVIGKSIISQSAFISHGATQIQFAVPPNAHDGRIVLREQSGNELIETKSKHMFYVVPRITGFGNSIVSQGEFLTIHGEGLDADPQMMSILFEASRGISQTQVVAVSGDRASLTVRVPEDAVSGFVRLIRKRVYSGFAAEDTSSQSTNKVTILTPQGLSSDVLLEERFDNDLSAWITDSGVWKIEQGALVANGAAWLMHTFDTDTEELYLTADVLNAHHFGLCLLPEGESLPLYIWFNLTTEPKTLSWSQPDKKGEQLVFKSTYLEYFADDNCCVQLKVVNGKVTAVINQKEIQSVDWSGKVNTVGVHSNSNLQRWDNILLLKKDNLVLSDPDFYRFGDVPLASDLPVVTLDTFRPDKGAPGTDVTISGSGFSNVKSFYFGGVKAEIKTITDVQAIITVPEKAMTGAIEAEVRGGLRISTGDAKFIVPPVITNILPAKALANSELHIIGFNMPSLEQVTRAIVLGTDAVILSTTPTMLKIQIPDITGKGPVSIKSSGFTSTSPVPLEIVRETVLADLIADAEKAIWTTAGGSVGFGLTGEEANASVAIRGNEKMEDGLTYGSVLYMHPPIPSHRALRGVYPVLDLPEGRFELRLNLGMLWSAAPTSEDITEADGVLFEVSFVFEEKGETTLLPKSACVHDGFLEEFIVDANDIAGQKGQLVVSVFPGRNGLRDDSALVFAKLIHVF